MRISLLIKTNHPDQSNPKYYTQKEMVFQQNLLEKAYFIAKMSGPAMVWLASSDFWKAPLVSPFHSIIGCMERLPVNNLLLFFLFCDDRHLWLKRHLKYWQSSRCPATQPPYPWMPWLLLLLSPSFGILFIVEAFNQLSRLFATLATISIIIFFNVCSFSKHRMQHISGLQSPALLGYFFGLIIQSLLWYFIYLTPHIL